MKNLLTLLYLAILGALLGSPVFAQTLVAPLASAPVESILSGQNLMALMTLVSGMVAIWRHNAATTANAQLTTAQRINQSLILGIETAGQIPEVQAGIDKLKAVVQAKATEYGVQPTLHALVQSFTDPAATATATPSK